MPRKVCKMFIAIAPMLTGATAALLLLAATPGAAFEPVRAWDAPNDGSN